ncbi:MAG: aldo/keto reductase [Xanthomonadales bacterium]|nr:aldo/keto reductase [Xanthomonadales bacterium]
MSEVQRVELVPGYSVARIINGCWQLTPDHGGGPGSEKEIFRIFSEMVELGFTTFDCADIYTGVEELLGRFRKTLVDPGVIQVHTKFVPDRNTLGQLTAAQLEAAVDRSLRRLGVDQLDLVQFHWWNYGVPGMERMTDVLLAAQQRGKIRLLGVTNFDTGHVRRMLQAGLPLRTLQAQYSLLDRRPERHMTRCCEETGVALLPYGVLAGGFLSERYLDQPAPDRMNRSLTKYRLIMDEIGGWDRFQSLLALLVEIARAHQTTVDQLAARWVMDQPGVAAIILGTGHRSRARRNLSLASLELPPGTLAPLQQWLADTPIPPGDMYELERAPDGRHSGIIRTELNALEGPA